MDIVALSELFDLISRGVQDIPARRKMIQHRKIALQSINESGFVKNAFDTRRIDQEIEINPRRGLQNYNRSEAFISKAMENKLNNLAKLKKVLSNLKEVYGREPEWQDSNARVLLSNLDKGLRSGINDGDYSESQPGVGSLDYIEELLHVRYRLAMCDIHKIADKDLKEIILSKDEDLIHKDMNSALEITKSDVRNHSYDTLLEKLFGGVRATDDNPEVERTITITIKDSIKK